MLEANTESGPIEAAADKYLKHLNSLMQSSKSLQTVMLLKVTRNGLDRPTQFSSNEAERSTVLSRFIIEMRSSCALGTSVRWSSILCG